jgi:hypothetical protein
MAVEDLILGVFEQPNALDRLDAIVTYEKLARIGPGAGILPLGTPLMRVAPGRYSPWQYGNAIHGFLVESITLELTKDTFGTIMLHGEIRAAAVVLPSGQLQADLNFALSQLREAGIRVDGLVDGDGPKADQTNNAVVPNFLGPTSVVYEPFFANTQILVPDLLGPTSTVYNPTIS